MNISQNKLARDIDVPPLMKLCMANVRDTDLRLSRALGTSEGFWLGLQADYDLEEKKLALKTN